MQGMLLSQVATCQQGCFVWLTQGASCVTKDITQLVLEDHNRLRQLYSQYRLAGNTRDQKRLLALDIIRHSAMHSKKEDMVLIPALYVHLGHQAVCHMALQHQHIEEQMELLLQMTVDDPDYDRLLHRYMTDTEAHLQFEEGELLPLLRKQLSPQHLLQLGIEFEWAKLIAPSRCRPHAWTPKAPVLCHVVNAMLTPIDFLLDMVAFGGTPTL